MGIETYTCKLYLHLKCETFGNYFFFSFVVEIILTLAVSSLRTSWRHTTKLSVYIFLQEDFALTRL